MPSVAVLIPAYNESRTIGVLLRKVHSAAYVKQIVVVDDGSTDGTGNVADTFSRTACRRLDITVVRHQQNCGKGAAIRTGLRHVRCEITILQDADLEYDPRDYPALIEQMFSGQASVVYGVRAAARGCARHRACRLLLNAAVRVLHGRRISDEATGYKAFRTELLRRLDLRCERIRRAWPNKWSTLPDGLRSRSSGAKSPSSMQATV